MGNHDGTKQRVLITGTGQMAQAFFNQMSNRYLMEDQFDVHYGCRRSEALDHLPGITIHSLELATPDSSSMLIEKLRPNWVIHTAAMTNVDKCEKNLALARRVNYDATVEIVEACVNVGAYLSFLSTDYVFDGEKGFYREDDEMSPVNVYGSTKMVAENDVTYRYSLESAVFRAGLIYSDYNGKNYHNYVRGKLMKKEPITAMNDLYCTPTPADALANVVCTAFDERATGIFHIAGSERLSRLGFAQKIALNLGHGIATITGASYDNLKDRIGWVAKRPKDSSLVCDRAERLLGYIPPSVGEALLEEGWCHDGQ